MRIERVVVRGLRALRARDDRLVDPGGKVHRAVCLRGLNGSGKTTYLDMLSQLWIWFRNCATTGGYVKPQTKNTSLLVEASLAAALFTELPGPRSRMWIAHGSAATIQDTLGHDPDSPYLIEDERVIWDGATLGFWTEAFARAEAGLPPSPDVPNIVWIEAENKWVPELRKDELARPVSTPSFVPVARYLTSLRGASHLEALMRTLFLARRDRWDLLARHLGELRPGLTLLDRFDEATLRPLFRLASGEILYIDRLSAGERSLLINLCMILRWLGQGGIVLLDEPELHQHLSLMRGSLAVIEAMLSSPEIGGQLLVASHAPEVWNHFRRPGSIIDLSEPE